MKRYFFPLLSVLSFIACSGAETGPSAQDDKLKNESSFCTEWANDACNQGVVAACNGTRAGCLQTQKSACQVAVPLGYSSKHAEDCLAAVKRAYADASLTAEELDVVLRLGGACKTLIDGGIAKGDACTSSFECDGVNGYECVIKPGDAGGSCQQPVEVGGGRNCATAAAVCEADFYCDGSNCVERVGSTQACTSDAMCQASMRCDIATGATDGTCVARTANAMSCAANEECESGLCIGATRKVCASNVVLTVESTLCDTLR